MSHYRCALIHASSQTRSAKATLRRGADGCHVNMPGRLKDWAVCYQWDEVRGVEERNARRGKVEWGQNKNKM